MYPSLPWLPDTADCLAYTIKAIKTMRHRYFPFLWWDLTTQDMKDTCRSVAWLVMVENQPRTSRELTNAVQRALYREAIELGWQRPRQSRGYRLVDVPLDFQAEPKYNMSN